MRHWTCWIVTFGIPLTLTGCNSIFTPKVEPHPDAPILITKTFGGFVKGAVYDKERNAMVPCGWFWAGKYDGWTLHKFDWNKRIEVEKGKPEQSQKEPPKSAEVAKE